MHAHRFRVLTALVGALALSLCFSCTKAGGGDNPVISHSPPVGDQPAGVPVQITAGVTDSDGVQSVAVYYQAPHAPTWNSALLSQGPSANTYVGEIPGEAMVAPGVNYYLEATDISGNSTQLPADAPTNSFSVTVGGSTGDTKGPTIGHVKVADGRALGSAVDVKATVNDATGVGSVTCFYRHQGSSNWESMTMTAESGTSSYLARFPIEVIVPEAVEYYLEAVDTAPAQNRSTLPMTAPAEIFTFTIAHGDETPPVITHTAIANGQPENRPVAVSARIEDVSGINRAEVFYRAHGTTTWTTLTMTDSGTGTWNAIIPGDVVTTTGVDYYIEAEDKSPLANVARSPEGAPTEFHTFTGAAETCVAPPLASESFEGGIFPGWWRTYNVSGCEWTVATEAAHDGSYSAYHPYGPSGTNCSDLLVFPCLDLSAETEGLVIDFWQYSDYLSTDEIHTFEWAENSPDPTVATYAQFGSAIPEETSSDVWGYRKISIPAGSPMLGKAKIYFAFRYEGTYEWDWALDSIRVRRPGPAIELASLSANPVQVNPGAANVQLTITLRNAGDAASAALTGVLSTTDSGITIGTPSATYGGAAAGGETTSATAYVLSVDGGHATGDAPLKLTLTDGTHTYIIDFNLYIGARATAKIVMRTADYTYESNTELYLGVGLDPANPTWISPTNIAGTGSEGTFTYDVDLTSQTSYLPPTLQQPWFLKAVHEYSGTLEIQQFTISLGATSYSALNLPWLAADGSYSAPATSYLMLPEPPRFAADVVTPTPNPVKPGDAVSMTVTVRNQGSATQGALTGTLSLKAPTTTTDVTGLNSSTAVTFASGPVGNNATATSASPWTFTVTTAHNDGSPVHFNLHLVDAVTSLTWDVPVDLQVPHPGVSVVDWGGATATYDSDGVPDPPSTGEGAYGLILVIQNTGSEVTAGPVHATLAINAASAGKATIASTQMAFGNTALAAGQKITSTNSVDLTLTGAVVNDTVKVDATFTDGTNTWVRTIPIPIYGHAGTDPKETSSGAEDLRFLLFHCDNETVDARVIGWASDTAEYKETSLILAHPSSGAVLRLALDYGDVYAYTLNAAGTGWDDATVPPSLTISPTTGSTVYLNFRVKLSDITAYYDASQKKMRVGAQEDGYPYDYLPDAWSGMAPNTLNQVTW